MSIHFTTQDVIDHYNRTKLLQDFIARNIDMISRLPYQEMYPYYKVMKSKVAEKFIEGWVANFFGGTKLSKKLLSAEDKKNDFGDLWFGNTLQVGKNNVELKCSFDGSTSISGGQFRFYDNVPYYLLFKAWDETRYDAFLLTKEELVGEIVARASTGKSSITSSQGSGVISKLSDAEKIQRLHENVSGKYQDKLGWGFNTATESTYYTTFRNKYSVTPATILSKFQ